MKVLSIGPDKDLLTKGSVSYERHTEYAKHCDELHAVIFARKKYGNKKVQIASNAWAYPTYSATILTLFLNAYMIGRRILRENGEWVISAQDPFESGLVAYALARITHTPLLIQEHGDFFSTPHWRRESFTNTVRYFLGRWLIRRADHVRPVSVRIASTLEHLGVPRERMTVCAVYTETSRFQDAQPDQELALLRPKHGILLVTMARLVPQKNIDMLIRSFSALMGKGVSARLLIVGRGPEELDLKRKASRAPEESIVFRDWVEHPETVMKSADVYVLSSNYEGWGRVCVEALATGLPLVMTDVGCAGEVVIDGKNGSVVPVEDEKAFTDALYALALDPELRQKYAEAGNDTVARMVTKEESIALYIESLQVCLQKKKDSKK
jgi:glycosyltransferase involved in cell wall biosynthesis